MRLRLLDRLLEKTDRLLVVVKQARRRAEIALLERELEPAIAEAFWNQGTEFMVQLGRLRDEPTDTWNEDDWLAILKRVQQQTAPLFVEPWKATCMEAIRKGVQLTADEVGVKVVNEAAPDLAQIAIAFGLRNPRAVQYLTQFGAELVANIDETTRDVIRGIVVNGISEGWSYDQMARAIISQFGCSVAIRG